MTWIRLGSPWDSMRLAVFSRRHGRREYHYRSAVAPTASTLPVTRTRYGAMSGHCPHSRCLTWLVHSRATSPQLNAKTPGHGDLSTSFATRGSRVQIPSAPLKNPGQGDFWLDSSACPIPGSADSRSTGDPPPAIRLSPAHRAHRRHVCQSDRLGGSIRLKPGLIRIGNGPGLIA